MIKPSTLLRLLGIAAAVAALVVLGRAAGGRLPAFLDWVAGLGAWGPAVFIAGYVVACVAFVPGWILTLAAGVLFGLARGTLYVFAGAVLGSTAAFLVSRHLARGAVARRIAGDARFAAVDRAIARAGLKIVFLLRLSPLFPFNLLNYALGLTQVRLRDYLLASVGMLPGSVLYVSYGVAIGSLAQVAAGMPARRDPAGLALFGIGLVATLLVTVYVTRLARRALAEATAGPPSQAAVGTGDPAVAGERR